MIGRTSLGGDMGRISGHAEVRIAGGTEETPEGKQDVSAGIWGQVTLVVI